MFRTFFAVALSSILCFSITATAAQVDLDSVQRAANGFLSANRAYSEMAGEKKPQPLLMVQGQQRPTGEADGHTASEIMPVLDEGTGEPLAYVVRLEPEGFVILAGDTSISPVLAFSFEGDFPMVDSPDNPFLQMIKSGVRAKLMGLSVQSQAEQNENEDKWLFLQADSEGGEGGVYAMGATTEQRPSWSNTGWMDTTWEQGGGSGDPWDPGDTFYNDSFLALNNIPHPAARRYCDFRLLNPIH